MQKSCAVTGATGYVGSRLAAALAATFDVVPLGRKAGASGIPWQLGAHSPGLAADLRARNVKVLIHSAWDFTHPRAADNRQINVEGSRRLFAAAQAAGVEHIVFISTISAFAGARSVYGRSKCAVEQLVLAAGGTVLRPGLVWGDRPGGMFQSLRRQVSQGGMVPAIGGGRYPQYLVHEDDLAASVVRAAQNEFPGCVLTLAHPRAWLLRDLILRMAAEQNRQVTLLSVPWRVIYAGIKAAELLGIKTGFRSDSVISLVYQDPAPQFAEGVPVREFR